jgi:hypothetical protein
MTLFADISAKIAADREAGRDVPTILEEYLMMIAAAIDPQPEEQPAKDDQSPSQS